MYRVILVEDEVKVREGLKYLVENIIQGFEVIDTASNGDEALVKISLSKPDVVITDVKMNRMNGIEMIRHLREHEPELFIIIISGYDDYKYIREALKFNVLDYLLKPINREELYDLLVNINKKLSQKASGLMLHEADPKSEVRYSADRNILLNRIKETIDKNIGKDLSLQFIAEDVNLNSNYLSNYFKSQTGQNLWAYILEKRMEKACQLLRESNLKIFEIAHLCGYQNDKYFLMLFKNRFEISPKEYRNKQKV